MRKDLGALLVLCACLIFPAQGTPAAATVKEVLIEGNQRIEDDAILRVIDTRAGDPYDPEQFSRDLEAIFEMGYFDDIQVQTRSGEDGKTVIFRVEEKPTIRVIEIAGNMVYKDEEIKENIDISTGSILNIFRIKRNIKQIETLYEEKNYHNVKVTHEVEELAHNQANLTFRIEEGKKLRIQELHFKGNAAFDAKTLKKQIETSEKGFFSWLTASGELDMETLRQDVIRLSDFYHNNGYADARIGEPEVEYREKGIFVEIRIEEGPRYEMGETRLSGDLILPEAELIEKLAAPEEPYFNRQAIREDVMAISDVYADEGYANAEIRPNMEKHEDAGKVDIVFHIEKNKPVYFEKIVIQGNTKTRDKVIRRELEVYEGGKYSGSKLKKSIRELYRLDYFKDVKVRRQSGSAEDQMVLEIQVEEKPTGSFSFGGGYSAVDNLYVVASITERNLFGRGQYLDLRLQMGGTSQQYDITFTEPWLFDRPLSATVQANQWERDYDDYTRDSRGGSFRFGYPVFDYTRAYVQYAYDVSDIRDVDEDVSPYLLEGEFVESSVSTSVVYDSRDRRFNPTEGSKHRLTLEYAGVGGDIGFTKGTAETGWYFPLFWKTTGFLHAETGYVRRTSDKVLPDYERFYLGGINSLRGFDWRDVSPVNEDGVEIGGDKFVQFNFEFLVPLLKEQGLVGVLFYDTGNAYVDGPIDLGDMRESWGYGIRWYSPMGPLRLERGMVLDPEPTDESDSRWEFSIGGSF
jgi:outer membrane protein insertion porin family